MKKRLGNLVLIFSLLLFGSLWLVSADWIGSETSYSNSGIGCSFSNTHAVWTNTTFESAVWITRNISVVVNSTGSVGNCSAWQTEANRTCCQNEYQCEFGGKCIPEIKGGCEDFKTKANCENANLAETTPAEKFFLSAGNSWKFNGTNMSIYNAKCKSSQTFDADGNCASFSDCVCKWSNNKCSNSWEDYRVCKDAPIVINSTGYCEYVFVSSANRCDDLGKVITTYQAVPNPSNYAGCASPPAREIACSAVVVVPFFSWINILTSVLGIGMVYFHFRKRV